MPYNQMEKQIETLRSNYSKLNYNYDTLLDENKLLIDSINKCKSVLQTVTFWFQNYEEGTAGKKLSNEAKTILADLKN